MADFLTTNGTSYHIEDIIINAKKELYLVSPYLQLSKTFFERLSDASKRGVTIKIIFGKDDLKPNEKSSIEKLNNLELYFFENLHAKCYFNEEEMVITSMNMYEFSEKHNREMGVLISKNSDKSLFNKAYEETISIINSSEEIEVKKSTRSIKHKGDYKKNKTDNSHYRGYCIRCEKRIPFDPDKPYCPKCYSIWEKYGDEYFIENVCHSCGEYNETSMAKPLCSICYFTGGK